MAVLREHPGRRTSSPRRDGVREKRPEQVERPAEESSLPAVRPQMLTGRGRRTIRKVSGKNWRSHYRLSVEIGLAVSLLLLGAVTRAPIYHSTDGFDIQLAEQEVVSMEEIQQTKQIERPPPPPRPPVPIEVPDDAVLDDEDLNLDVTLDITETPAYVPPPPKPVEKETPEEVEQEIFVVVEEMPEIIGGTNKIYEYLEYPMIARQAQMEGLVVVQVVVEPDGSATSPLVVKSAGKVLDDAAVAAVMKLQFKPGRQRGRAVRVKMAIPIRFLLRDRKD